MQTLMTRDRIRQAGINVNNINAFQKLRRISSAVVVAGAVITEGNLMPTAVNASQSPPERNA